MLTRPVAEKNQFKRKLQKYIVIFVLFRYYLLLLMLMLLLFHEYVCTHVQFTRYLHFKLYISE